MDNLPNATYVSKVFSRPVPIRPLDKGRFNIENVIYESWEIAAVLGMSQDKLKHYHAAKLTRKVFDGEDIPSNRRREFAAPA